MDVPRGFLPEVGECLLHSGCWFVVGCGVGTECDASFSQDCKRQLSRIFSSLLAVHPDKPGTKCGSSFSPLALPSGPSMPLNSLFLPFSSVDNGS